MALDLSVIIQNNHGVHISGKTRGEITEYYFYRTLHLTTQRKYGFKI